MSVFIQKSRLLEKLKKLNFLRKNYPILIYSVLSLFVLVWFHGRDFINAGDLSWPENFDFFFRLASNIWDSSVAPGYNASRQFSSIFPYAAYGFIFYKLGLNAAIFQRFIYIVSFFFSGFGFYLLASHFVNSKFSRFLAGLMYMLSPYAAIVVWNPTYGLTFPFYTWLPLCLYFYLNYLKNSTILNGDLYLALLVSFFSFLSASYSNPAFFIVYIALLFVFSIPYVLTNGKKSLHALVFLFIYLITNIYWLLPFFSSIGQQYAISNNEPAGLVSDNRIQYINSIPLLKAPHELGFWAFYAEDMGDSYYSFVKLYENPIYTFVSWLIVILILLSFKKYDYKTRIILALFVLGILLNSALLFPFNLGYPIKLFLNLPFIDRAFRSVYLKLGILISISVPILFAYAFDKINNRLIYKLSLTAVLVLIIFRSYPFLTGTLIKAEGNYTPSYAVTIPDDYKQMVAYINALPGDDYLLTLPLPQSYNYVYKWQDGGYTGSDFMRKFIYRSNYYVNWETPLVNEFIKTYDPNILGKLGIRYILLHKDIPLTYESRYKTNDFYAMVTALGSINYKLLKETRNLALYEVVNANPYPLFYGISNVKRHVGSYESFLYSNNPADFSYIDAPNINAPSVVIVPKVINSLDYRLKSWDMGWAWPEANISPRSWKYILVKVKEDFLLATTKNITSKIDLLTWLVSKRSVELATYNLNSHEVLLIQERTNSYLTNLETLLKDYRIKSPDAVTDYVNVANKVTKYINKSSALIPENLVTLKNILNKFNAKLLYDSTLFCSDICYTFKSTYTGELHMSSLYPDTKVFAINDYQLIPVVLTPDGKFNAKENTEYLITSSTSKNNKVLPTADSWVLPKDYMVSTNTYDYLYQSFYGKHMGVVYKNPSVKDLYWANLNPGQSYNLNISISNTRGEVTSELYELYNGVVTDEKVMPLLSKLLSDKKQPSLRPLFTDLTVTDKKILKNNSFTVIKQFKTSSTTLGVYLRLFLFSQKGDLSLAHINDIYLTETPKLDLLLYGGTTSPINTPITRYPYNKVISKSFFKSTDLNYIINLTSPSKYLVFNAGFDPGWVATYKNKQLDHYVADGYRNIFVLPDNYEDGTISLKYTPDEKKFTGVYISLGIIFVIITAELFVVGKNIISRDNKK